MPQLMSHSKTASTKPAVVVSGVRVTHPRRILYPDAGITKLRLAQFYEQVSDSILPHLTGRPLTLVRCPEGVGAPCFYMKHAHGWVPPGIGRIRIREKKHKVGEYLVADSIEALIGLVQMGILEIHTWNSTAQNLECPDRIVFDLDPGPGVAWRDVVTAARLLRSALLELELRSFVKTTGGRGLHVVVPLEPDATWTECAAFARGVAEAVAQTDSRRYTTAFARSGRERKILIDHWRNSRGNTSVAAFSTRAKPSAPLSVPLDWNELTSRVHSDQYTVRNLNRRLGALKSDPWEAYWTTFQRLPAGRLARGLVARGRS